MPVPVLSCPACHAVDYQETGPVAPAFSAAAGEERFVQPAYRIRKCGGCGLLYRDCVLSPAEFARYYASIPFSRWEATGYHPTEQAVLSILETLPARSRILDFGCSSGRLLASMIERHQCFGFEIDAEAAAAADARGLRMLSLPEIEHARAAFDAILLVDVFE
ncbi:MAG TPA: methionine biosynthesis protein MetW, partial [Chthoniobacterales bacterium]